MKLYNTSQNFEMLTVSEMLKCDWFLFPFPKSAQPFIVMKLLIATQSPSDNDSIQFIVHLQIFRSLLQNEEYCNSDRKIQKISITCQAGFILEFYGDFMDILWFYSDLNLHGHV